MAVVHQLRLISDIEKLRISEDEIEELQEDIDKSYQPNTDPLDISKEIRLQAEEELNETPEKMKENIVKLRQLLLSDKTLKARTDDIFLAAFLRARKHDVEKAYQCMKNYYQFKSSYPQFYTYILPSENKQVYDLQHFSSIPGTDLKGRRMCVLRPGKLDFERSALDETFQLGTTVFEIMLEDPALQVTGSVAILDMKDLTLMQQARLATPSLAWHLTNIVQDKIPLRIKAVHVINQPFYFNAIYAVFKPFLKKKLKKRIFLHGNDFESLHKHIDPANLPKDFGGKKKRFTNRVSQAIVTMNEHKFKEWQQYTYIGENS